MLRSTLHAIGLLMLRLCVSGLMLAHAWQEWGTFYGTENFPDPLGLGSQPTLVLTIVSEVLFSMLLIVGLATRLAALNLAVMMAVAFFVVYGGDPWQKKELVAAYFCIYFSILAAGGGLLAVDRFAVKWFRQRSKRKS